MTTDKEGDHNLGTAFSRTSINDPTDRWPPLSDKANSADSRTRH